MYGEDFTTCLRTGEKAETIVKELIESWGYNSVKKMKGKHAEYDLLVQSQDGEYKVEVKSDKYAVSTRNIFVEVGKIINDQEQPSGLSVTQADMYVFKLWGMPGVYFISVPDLRKLVKHEAYYDRRMAGDRNSAINLVFDRDMFLGECTYEHTNE